VGTVIFITTDGERYAVEATAGASIMQLATINVVPGIDAECGGSLSCATCHVYVDDEWFASTGAAEGPELDMLEFAEDPKPSSRLSCQIRYDDHLDGLVLHVPEGK
jgi:2Fe-2S ferredoxin